MTRPLLLIALLISPATRAADALTTRPTIIPAAEWGSKPLPIPDARKHTPKYITVHHAGVLWKTGDDPVKKLQGLQAYGQRDKNWPDLPYHFLIAPDGRIFAGRPVHYEPETNTTYKTTGHLGIELWGDFTKQRPSKEQVTALVNLTAHLATDHKIEMKDIGAHKDRAQTACPGQDLYRYFESGQFRDWVKAAQSSTDPKIDLGPPLKNGPTDPIPAK
jgi:hypothetical protein